MDYTATEGELKYSIGKNTYKHFGKYYNEKDNHNSFICLSNQINNSVKDYLPKHAFIEFDLRSAESCPQGTIRVKTKSGLGKDIINIVRAAMVLNVKNSPKFCEEDFIDCTGFYADALCGSGFLNNMVDCLAIEKRYMEYNEYLNSKEWVDKRNKALKFADFKCTKCGNKEHLHVHHLNYENVLNETQGDLLVVCENCHNDIHNVC